MGRITTEAQKRLDQMCPSAKQFGRGLGEEIGNAISVDAYGEEWFVDSSVSASGSGETWANAFLTIAEANTACAAGDRIYIRGSFTEAVVNTKAGVSYIGAENTPNQAKWTAAADAICLTIGASGVVVANIRFSVPAYTSGTPSAIQLGNASYAQILYNRFQGKTGSRPAIYSPVCNSDNVHIIGNEFHYMNTATHGAGILGVEAGGLSYSAWTVKDNVFASCVTAMDFNGRVCILTGNTIAEYGITAAGAVDAVLAMGIDLSGTSSGGNMVWGNQLGGTYSATLYVVGASGDQWGGNFNVISGGLTAANPA